ncbi:ankyrin repeat domain-containing protein [Photobacterium leiognathi]|uniref:ankyrin repeat domain-containing protein n=1 Tax=Photobacterium leiognathi TaxID=553611 RepID=UPI002980A4A6|nr:ankyrin repeat domain-containing protein [Photobacterium leiognathi]
MFFDTFDMKENDSMSQILGAIELNLLDKVVSIIDSGFDIESSNNKALKTACIFGNVEIVRYLVESGANIFQNHNEALWLAVCERHTSVVAYLLSQGAELCDRSGNIWEKACELNDRNDAFSHLISIGLATLEKKDLLDLIDEAFENNDELLVTELISSLSRKDSNTALSIAVDYGNSKEVRQIISQFKSFDLGDDESETILFSAWYKCEPSLILELISAGVSISDALSGRLLDNLESIDYDLLDILMKAPNKDKDDDYYIADAALCIGAVEIAKESINNLLLDIELLNMLFSTAMIYKVESLYRLFMSLNAHPPVEDDWLYVFLCNLDDLELCIYLLSSNPDGEYSGLADNAIRNEDWDWLEKLVFLGVEPSAECLYKTWDAIDTVDKANNNTKGKIAFFLNLAEKGNAFAARKLSKIYKSGSELYRDLEKAVYWNDFFHEKTYNRYVFKTHCGRIIR